MKPIYCFLALISFFGLSLAQLVGNGAFNQIQQTDVNNNPIQVASRYNARMVGFRRNYFDTTLNQWRNKQAFLVYGGQIPEISQHLVQYDFQNQRITQTATGNGQWVFELQASPISYPYPNGPGFLHSHAAVNSSINGMIIFGGVNASGVATNDMWIYDYLSLSWSPVAAKGPIPSARFNHTMIEIGGKIFLFGGQTSSGQILGDMHIFNTTDLTWYPITYTQSAAERPTPRYGHSVVSYQGNCEELDVGPGDDEFDVRNCRNFATSQRYDREIIVFGGFDANERYTNDLWRFRIDTQIWSRIIVKGGQRPTERAHHISVGARKGRLLIVFGGYDGSNRLNDVWIFDNVCYQWFQLNPNNRPAPRSGHTAFLRSQDDGFVVFGGIGQNGLPTGDIFSYVAPASPQEGQEFCQFYDNSANLFSFTPLVLLLSLFYVFI